MHCVMLLILRCLSLAGLAAAIGNGVQDIQNRKVMRAEKAGAPDTMGIDSTGSLFEMGVIASNSADPVPATTAGSGASLADTPSDEPCNQQYLPGVEKSINTCSQGTHRPVVTPRVCMEAAAIAGALIEEEIGSRFLLTETVDLDTHPANCFAKPCKLANNTGKMCYYYNPEGEPSCLVGDGTSGAAECNGTPICYATRYGKGTTDANDGCESGSSVINGDDGEVACRKAASCLGYIPGDQFMIGDDPTHNASEHLNHPLGCFIATSGQFHFNRLSALGTPTEPKGTPVCSPSSVHTWA